MPIYTIETPTGQRLKIEAPDEATALRGAQEWKPPALPEPKNQSRIGMVDEAMQEGQQPNIGLKGMMKPGDRVNPDLTGMAQRGFTYQVGDEAVAAMGAPLDVAVNKMTGEGPTSLGESYGQIRAFQNAQEAATRDKYPNASVAAEVVGGLANAPAQVGKVVQGGNLLSKTVRGGAAGGAMGGLSSFGSGGESLEDRQAAARSGALGGAVTGSVIPPLASAAGKLVQSVGKLSRMGKPSAIQEAAPTLEHWQAEKQRLYEAADTGIGQQRMAPQNFDALVRSSNKIMNSRGFGGAFDRISQDLYKDSSGVVKHLNNIAEEIRSGKSPAPTWSDLERLRQDLRASAMEKITPDGKMTKDGQLLDELIDKVDDFMELAPFKEARQAFRILRKSERIRDAFYRAQNATAANYTQAGFETALRQQFRRIAESKNFRRQFSKAEQDAIQKVIDGDRVQNFLRRIGGLAPKGGLTGMFNLGMTFYNPWIGVPLATATTGSRLAATSMGIKNAQNADALVRNGGVMPQLPDQTTRTRDFLTAAPFGLIPYGASQYGQ